LTLRRLKYIFLLFVAAHLFHSCTIEKRHYRSGFYVAGPHESQRRTEKNHDPFAGATKNEADSVPGCKESELIQSPCKQDNATTPLVPDSVAAHAHDTSQHVLNSEKIESVDPVDDRAPSPAAPDEPGSDRKDRPNRTVLILIALAFFFVACIVFIFAGPLPFALAVIIVCCPLIGVLLYTAAMIYRQKLLQAIARGMTGEKLRVSAYYNRFKILFYLFFSAVLLGLLGLVFAYSTGFGFNSILGVFGVLMFGAGIGLLQVLSVFLLIFFLFYLFKWRKDPTGNSAKRPNRPPKDR